MPLAEGKAYESVKIEAGDYSLAEQIAVETGLGFMGSVGAALEGWASLPKTVRERIRRARLERAAANDGRKNRADSRVA